MKEAADLKALFANFERSAFRLETLDRYTVPAEEEALTAFKAGRPTPPRTINTANLGCGVVNDATQAGKHISRVHIIGTPHTDYIRFELDAYAANVEVGEDIRIGHRSEAPRLSCWSSRTSGCSTTTPSPSCATTRRAGFLGAEDATARCSRLPGQIRERLSGLGRLPRLYGGSTRPLADILNPKRRRLASALRTMREKPRHLRPPARRGARLVPVEGHQDRDARRPAPRLRTSVPGRELCGAPAEDLRALETHR